MRLESPGPEFHDLAGAHARDGEDDDDRGGPDDADQSFRLVAVQRACPWNCLVPVGPPDAGRISLEGLGQSRLGQGRLDQWPQGRQPGRVEVPVAGFACERVEVDLQQGVAGFPAVAEALADQGGHQLGQRVAVAVMAIQDRREEGGRVLPGSAPARAGRCCPCPHGGRAAEFGGQVHCVRAEAVHHVERCGQHRLRHLVRDGRGLVLVSAVGHLRDR